jgi:P4 family phage/plasmid primase-like protien
MTRANLQVVERASRDISGRPEPDRDAEESVLGSMILSRPALEEAVSILDAEDFSRDHDRTLFRVLGEMHSEGKQIDHTLLTARLREDGKLEAVGDRAYLLTLTGSTPNYGNIKHYCALVKESSNRRALYDQLVSLEIAVQHGDYQGQLARLQSLELEGTSPKKYFDNATFVPMWLATDILKRYELRYAGQRLYCYMDGVYRPQGEDTIRQEAQHLLGEKSNETRKRETISYIETERATDYPAPDCVYVNVLNGSLCWRTGELVAHDPQVFDTVQLPVEYDPAATCPAFDHFLETTLDAEVIPLIEELMGYSLIPDTRYEKAFVLTGPGSNGKSVFLDTLTALLGSENVSGIDLQSLEENRFAAAALVGKLANVHADLDARALKSSTAFKALVTGDMLTVERKYCEPFEYKNRARLIFSANSVPLAADKSFAFIRRLVIVPFDRTFTGEHADKYLREKLSTPEELSGIFNRALAGLDRLYSNSDFTIPAQVDAALGEYHRANDSVVAFVSECCDITPDGRIAKADFRAAYGPWCVDQGMTRMGDRKIKESLRLAVPGLGEAREGNRGRPQWTGFLSPVQGYSKD